MFSNQDKSQNLQIKRYVHIKAQIWYQQGKLLLNLISIDTYQYYNYINIYQCMGHSKMHFFVVGFFLVLNIGFGCHSQYLVEVGGEISKKCYLSRI